MGFRIPSFNPAKAISQAKQVAGKVANAVKQEVREVRDEFVPAAKEALTDVQLAAQAAYYQVRDHLARTEVIRKPELPVPPKPQSLRIQTYNIHGGEHLAEVEKQLRASRPDVVCLQEASSKTASRLADALGMHVAFNGDEGKAILSRYPIVEAEHVPYDMSFSQQWEAADRKNAAEPLIRRGMLRATLQVGDRKLDVIDTHLSLREPAMNADELRQLTRYVEGRKQAGNPVVAAGDFNVNFASVRGGTADPNGTYATPTDTVEEYRNRYPGRVVGNAEDARVRQAYTDLTGVMSSQWDAPTRTVQLGGETLTPEQAQQELASGKVPVDSPRHQQLLAVMDGVSHFSAGKRFDNVLASKDLELRSAQVALDVTQSASDHSAVMLEVGWK